MLVLVNNMHGSVAVLVAICLVVVSGDFNCTKSGGCSPFTCGPLEVPVKGKPQQDYFCRPLFAPTSLRQKLRTCLCKRGYLRNSWDECVPRMKCIPCKFQWQRDYRTCMPGCPKTCETPFGSPCSKPCTAGCDCPPGYVTNPKFPKLCMKISNCHRICPENSSFKSCASNCLPKCGQRPPKTCDTKCRGACVCNVGYVELERDGKKACILQEICSRLTSLKTNYSAGQNLLLVPSNNTGHFSEHPVRTALSNGIQNVTPARGRGSEGSPSSVISGTGGLPVGVTWEGAFTSAMPGTPGKLVPTAPEAGGRNMIFNNLSNTLSVPSGDTGNHPRAASSNEKVRSINHQMALLAVMEPLTVRQQVRSFNR
uniref:Putative thyropin n=1 Tax=Rhipicephalus microplus TaxID=6941 RepID=A0A6G5A808_RHIMP